MRKNISFRVIDSVKSLIKTVFRDLLANSHNNLVEKIFILDYVDKKYYVCHKITLTRNRSWIGSKAVIYLKNKNSNYFSYSVFLNHQITLDHS